MKRLIPAAVLLIVSALALAACGGGESDEDKIASVVEKATTSKDPASCEETQTKAFIEQTNTPGPQALKECEEDAEEGKGNPESVDVSEVEVEGSEASAAVAIHGGSFDGQTLEVALVEEGGDWKLNEFVGFKVFNREKLIASFEEQFEQSEAEPKIAECVLEAFEEGSDTEIEEVVITGNEAITELLEECVE